MKYHHIGIPTKEKLQDEIYLPHLKMYGGGYGKNDYGIEWMRFDDDTDFPEIVRTLPHVAFEVNDLELAIRGKKVIIKPNNPCVGVLVAFVEDNGEPVELMQIDCSIVEDGI